MMRWFRMYNDAVDDEKLRLLAFEDRWHYVALLCLKSEGLLDEKPSDLKDRKIALKLGLTTREAEEVKRRLSEVGLISKNWQPTGWKKRQYEHDSSAARTREYRARKKQAAGHGDVTVTYTDTDTDTDTDTEKDRGTKRKRFTPPTLADVEAYAKERSSSVNPSRFVSFYESKDWLVGKNKMKDWKAAFRGWEVRENETAKPDPDQQKRDLRREAENDAMARSKGYENWDALCKHQKIGRYAEG